MPSNRESLATGIKATHIGPETGGWGSATAGEGSSAGTKDQSSPAPASGLDDAAPAPTGGRKEARSFRPAATHPASRPAASGPIDDADQELRDITDGKDRPSHKHEDKD